MKAKITKIKGTYQKGKSFNNIGTYFMTYKGKKYYSGDAIVVYDRTGVPYETVIVEDGKKIYMYGFFYASIGGLIDVNKISDFELYKSYKDLKDGEEIFDFKVDIKDIDNLDVWHMEKHEMQPRLSSEVKLRLVELDMYPLLEKIKDTSLTQEQRDDINMRLHELGKEYVILYDIVKEHKHIEKYGLSN